MNPKELISRQFIDLEAGFIGWLRTLGYSEATIATRKRNIKEFLLSTWNAQVSAPWIRLQEIRQKVL